MILLLLLTMGILHIVEGTEPAVEISYEEIAHLRITKQTLYSITCSVTDMPLNANIWLSMVSPGDGTVYYFRDDLNEIFWYRIRYDSDSSVTIVFNHFDPQWEGQYTCLVRENTTDPLEWSSKPVYLKYTTMPEIQDLIADRTYAFNYDRRLFLNDGSELHVQCVASGVPEPKIVWKKTGIDNFISEGPLLDVPSVTKADSGFYFCEADNGIGDPVISTELEVKVLDFFPPQIKYTSEPVITITEDLNDYWTKVDTTMEVLVNGLPPPTVTWWKETEKGREQMMRESTSSHRILIYEGFVLYPETETKHKLIIESLKTYQLGTYVAKAENSLGVAELKFTINAAGTAIQR